MAREWMVVIALAGCGRLAFDPASDAADDAGWTDGSSSDGSGFVIGCDGHPMPRAWRFEADTEGWTFFDDVGTSSNASWTASTFQSPPGAFRVDLTGGVGRLGWFLAPSPFGNLTTRTVAVWMMTQSTGVSVKVYGQNLDTTWVDGGIFNLTRDVWTCVTLSIDAPVFESGGFDPTSVDEIGIQVDGDSNAIVVIDDPGY